MVNEYWDMFFKELLGLLPTRMIEFIIEIIYSRSVSISIVSYRMAPVEKQE